MIRDFMLNGRSVQAELERIEGDGKVSWSVIRARFVGLPWTGFHSEGPLTSLNEWEQAAAKLLGQLP